MKKTIRITLWTVFLLTGSPGFSMAQTEVSGFWQASIRGENVKITFNDGRRNRDKWMTTKDFKTADFDGWTRTDEASFRLVRDAGTFSFTGTIDHHKGYGLFTFEADGDFEKGLEDLGFKHFNSDELVQMAIFDVDKDFVEEISEAGYPDLELQKYIQCKIHGVDRRFIRKALESFDRKVSIDKIIELKLIGR